MNDKLLVETAVLTGEIMLTSGAEIYRVEDTMNRILQKAKRQTSEAVVFSTGIFVTLNDPEIEPITVVKRVSHRTTNLNKLYLANEISRKLCGGSLEVEEAYLCLRDLEKKVQYKPGLKRIGIMGACAFFASCWEGTAWNAWARF